MHASGASLHRQADGATAWGALQLPGSLRRPPPLHAAATLPLLRATQVEAALRQGDRAARSAAINHLAEVLVQDADAAEELLAAISAAVQRQQQGAAAEQQALPHAAVAQQLQPQPPQPMPAPPQAAPQRPTPRLAVMPPQPPQKPPQQQALVEPLPAAWQGMQLPGSQPVSMQQQQQPQLPTNLVGKQLGAGQQPPAQLQQEDLAAVLHVLRAAFEPPSRAAQQPGPSLDLLWQAQQAAQLQKGAVPGGDQLSPLLQQLLKWGQPELQPKQEQQPLGAGPAAALPSVEQPAPQQPQPATHGGAAAPGGSAASPRKTLADTVLAMELLEAAAQQRPSSGQAGAEALLPQPSLVSQQQAVAVPSDDVSLLAAAAQQARGGTAAQEAAAQQVAAMAALPAPVASPQQELAGLGVPPPAP